MLTLSILVPVYNEQRLIAAVLDRVLAAPSLFFSSAGITAEVIVVDDGSTDSSCAVLEEYLAAHPAAPVRLIRHARNQGKGAAIRTALAQAAGTFSIIQDADLEYDPREYPNLLRPLLTGEADAVFGSRFLSAGEHQVLSFWHTFINRVFTTLTNLLTDLDLTDMATCFKAFRTGLAQSLPLRSNRFGFDGEVTVQLAKRHARIYEVPITYRARSYAEGKKIGARDAVALCWAILRTRLRAAAYSDQAADMLAAMEGAHRFNRWMADTLLPYLGGDVLELGAGIGNLTRLLSARARRYVVTDIDKEHLAELQAQAQYCPNIRVAPCDLANSKDFEPFARSMDAVVCLNVLEHIEDDALGLSNIFSSLKPGGRAIVLVPQGAAVFGTLDETLGHYRRYSSAELAQKMTVAGFRMDRLLEFNRVTYPGWFLNGRILKRRYVSRIQLRIFDLLVPLWRRIDRYLPWPPTSLIAIGIRDD